MTSLALVLLAASVSIKTQSTPLRTGCETADEVIATLPAGTPVDIRFAMTGPTEPCYKVSSSFEGKPVQGYLPASSLQGLDNFEKARTEAPAIRSGSDPVSLGPKPSALPLAGGADGPLARASGLLQEHQPGAALELIEKSMKVRGRDYQALVMAGIAAYQSDHLRLALDYLREAREIKADHVVDQWIARVEKEAAGDRSGEKLYGTRFLLRYEGEALPSEVARGMVATLEEEFSRISMELGCRTDERIVTIVQSRQAYRETTGAVEWSGGHYDGKIHIPLPPNATVSPDLRRTFAHELVHACLAQMGNYPVWLHEGLAQKLSGETISNTRVQAIRNGLRQNRIPRLENMSPSWSRMSTEHATLAYAYSLAAVNTLTDRYQAYGIQNVLRNPERLPAVMAELDKLLAE
jgi:hypothetical protein